MKSKLRPGKLLERFNEAASLPLPGTRQREGGRFRVSNEQFDGMPFTRFLQILYRPIIGGQSVADTWKINLLVGHHQVGVVGGDLLLL